MHPTDWERLIAKEFRTATTDAKGKNRCFSVQNSIHSGITLK
jgi:hypothetical protein